MRSLVLCVAVAGCGFQSSIAPDSGAASAGDGGPGDGAADAGVDCFAQWRSGPLTLSSPHKLSSLTSAGDDRDPWISHDRLTLYFTSNRTGNQEIYRASRTAPDLPFGPPDLLINLHVTDKDQERAALTADEKTLVLASNRGANRRFQLFATVRPDTMTEFGSPDQRHLAMVNVEDTDNHDPFLSSDGRTLYFTQDTGGPAHPRIMVATRIDPAGDFDPPAELGGVNRTGSNTADPALALGDRVIVFSSDRDGGSGSRDLWYATREDALHEFPQPAPIPMVNTGEDDADPMLSDDGCELYFASTFEDDYNLYVSTISH